MTRVEYARRQIENRIYLDAIGQSPGAKWKLLRAFFTEHGFAERVLRKRLGLPTPLNTTDRIVMERDIFPEYARDPAIKRMLFVGCGRTPPITNSSFFPTRTSGPSSRTRTRPASGRNST